MLDGLTQGDFYVKFEVPNQKYGFTIPRAGVDDIDSDVDGTYGNGSTRMFRILAGEVRPTIDAGVVAQVLSLKWLKFDGKYNGSFMELNWATGIEVDNDHFEIERRFENEKNFVTIEKMAAHANPYLTEHDYEFDDFDVKNTGVYFYRLKQVDKDGTFTYSKIISVRIKDEKHDMIASIYPNPVSALLKIELWIPEDTELEVKVFDANGKEVMNAPFSQFKTKGKYNESLQTNELTTGQYVLQIKASSGVIHRKFTVVK